MKKIDENFPVEIFSGTMWEAGMVKSLLENAEIEVFLKNEILGTYAPWQVEPGGEGAVKVLISSLDYESAKSIVDEYQRNVK
jgi:hypothetical protein